MRHAALGRMHTRPGSAAIACSVAMLLAVGCGDGGSGDDAVDAAPPADAPTTSPLEPACQPTCGYEVVAEYPHDPAAFTQGLVIDRGLLFEGTGLYGESTVRRVDLTTGDVLQRADLPADFFGEGITVWEDRIVQLTWLEQSGFVHDRNSFEMITTFAYETEGWGLTHDGRRLIMSDGTATLTFLDPVTFAPVGSVQVSDDAGPVELLNELEYIQGEVFANVWGSDRIVRIDPDDGRVVGDIDLRGLGDLLEPPPTDSNDVLNGIAFDRDTGRLLVSGKRWPSLFEIRLVAR